jgi:hypothetical protein
MWIYSSPDAELVSVYPKKILQRLGRLLGLVCGIADVLERCDAVGGKLRPILGIIRIILLHEVRGVVQSRQIILQAIYLWLRDLS